MKDRYRDGQADRQTDRQVLLAPCEKKALITVTWDVCHLNYKFLRAGSSWSPLPGTEAGARWLLGT